MPLKFSNYFRRYFKILPKTVVSLNANSRGIACFLVWACLVPRVVTAADAVSPCANYNFNPGWKLSVMDSTNAALPEFDDSAWKPVTLPHAWNEDSAFKVSIHDLPTGIAWYRKHFKLPADAAGKKVFLEFQGIRHGGEFYLNGEWIGRSENGVMAFGFDLTDKLKPGENVIAARIDNSWNYHEHDTRSGFEWNDKNFYANYGGINKNVILHITDKLHQTLSLYSNLKTTGVYIFAEDFDLKNHSAKITAESQIKNEYAEPRKFSYEVSIADADGKQIAAFGSEHDITLGAGETTTVSVSSPVSDLNFWSWGYGYLYNVTTTLKVDGQMVDSVVTRTGFRKTEFTNGLVKLNERTIHLKGYAQRSTDEWPGVGNAVPPWMSDFSENLMVESGANLVRWMHVTPGKQNVEACDRVGLMQAMPAGDSEKDVDGRRWQQRVELMRDAIIYNRNNPSIVFYECGNNQISEAHMAEMKSVRDQFDPHGGRAIGCRNMLDSKVAEYGGEMLYINKSAGKPMWMMEYSRDEGLRKFWDDFSPPFHKDGDGPPAPKGENPAPYNRNQDSHAIENVVRWFDYWHERPGTGARVNAGGVNIYFSDSQTHFRGAADYRCSGEVDAMRLPKDGFFAHQVMWSGWVDVEQPAAHILGHWNYAAGVTKAVNVVSSADKVELFVNGQSHGFGERSSHFLFTWKDIAFQPGEIKAVGYDINGNKLCETEIKTAGAPAAIKLTPHSGPNGLRADGADMVLVDVEVVDADGNRCPTAMNEIKFDLQGAAEWRGGIAVGTNNFILSKNLPVECGVNRVILRSLPQAGKIILSASANGLKPASIEVDSVPFFETGGLAKMFPDAGLTNHLTRGPTPAGDALVITRKNIRIISATAGSNPEAAGLAFDDNEATGWKSDGKRGTAWIQFELEQPANVGEIELKLGGFRGKSYPVRITVDGKEVFAGNTPKTLGYATLSVKPTLGKSLRVQLVGAIDDHDAFGLVEVAGKTLKDKAASGSKGSLEIIEAEIYESPPLVAK
jgi:beta-galactosidase